jgi:hypothetical protein
VVLAKVVMNAGTVQLDLGQAIGPGSGGRYESINLPSRLVTLLPEFGAKMATALKPGAKQFRITVERASAGPLGALTLGIAGKAASNVKIDRKP